MHFKPLSRMFCSCAFGRPHKLPFGFVGWFGLVWLRSELSFGFGWFGLLFALGCSFAVCAATPNLSPTSKLGGRNNNNTGRRRAIQSCDSDRSDREKVSLDWQFVLTAKLERVSLSLECRQPCLASSVWFGLVWFNSMPKTRKLRLRTASCFGVTQLPVARHPTQASKGAISVAPSIGWIIDSSQSSSFIVGRSSHMANSQSSEWLEFCVCFRSCCRRITQRDSVAESRWLLKNKLQRRESIKVA